MKIYVASNLDGTNQAMVIAANLKEAAKRIGTSVHQLREYGWHYANEHERAEMMNVTHSHPLFAPIDHRPPHTYWRVGRWKSDEVRAALTKVRRVS